MAGPLRVPGRLGSSLAECGYVLQVALDYTSLWDAVALASRIGVWRGLALEVGTPL